MGCRPPGWLCCGLPVSDRQVGGVQHQNCRGVTAPLEEAARGPGGPSWFLPSRKERALQWAAFHSKGIAFPRPPLGPPPVEGSPLPPSGRGSRTQTEPCQPRAPRVCRWTPNCAQERGAPLQPWRRSQSSRPTAVCRGHAGGSPAGSFSSVLGQTQKLAPQTLGSHIPLHCGQRGKCLCILCVCFPITGAHPDIHNGLGWPPCDPGREMTCVYVTVLGKNSD